MLAVQCVSLMTRPTVPDADADNIAASLVIVTYAIHSEANDPDIWLTLAFATQALTYFRQPPNLSTAARRNRKCTECGTTAFGRNRMSAKSAHLSTSGAVTETLAEIRSTSV